MLNYQDLLMQQMHYQELRREAEKERLLKRAAVRSTNPIHLHRQALGWLGSQLVVWGRSLQTRYGAPATLVSNHKS